MLIVVGSDFIWETGFVWMCYELIVLNFEGAGDSFFLL